MIVESNVALQPYNSFGIACRAQQLVRIASEADVQALLADPPLRDAPKFILGGGSNIVLTGDVRALVLKVEITGRRLVRETPRALIVEAGAGEDWHQTVRWTLDNGFPGLENLALIPGTVGGAPVQNIGAYGVELQDRFDSLDAIDLDSGRSFSLDAAQCAFGYRDSVWKHATPHRTAEAVGAASGDTGAMRPLFARGAAADTAAADTAGAYGELAAATSEGSGHAGFGLLGRALITRVRFSLPKPWRPVLGYADLEKKIEETGVSAPDARTVFDWVVAIRRAKLPDWRVLGNAGSFFKNPSVTPEQCADIIARDPKIVHYPMPDGSIKLAAGWLIDACGWKGKSIGNAGVYERQALVLVNRGGNVDPVTGGEVMTLAKAIQTSVYERFGIRLEPEPVVV